MILSTGQSPDFDITKELVDLSKSEYYSPRHDKDTMFKDAYDWLFKFLKHDKFVWCYQGFDRGFLLHGYEYQLWTLDVPDEECIRINSEVWHCVLNNSPYFDYDGEWDDAAYDKFYDIFNVAGKREQTWEDNIFKFRRNEHVEILVKSPVLDKYVIKKEWISDYDCEVFDEECYHIHFNTFEEANHVKEIYENGLRGRKLEFTSKIVPNESSFGLKIDWKKNGNVYK